MLRGEDQILSALPIVSLARDNSPQLRVFILEWISDEEAEQYKKEEGL